jgi:hypothetical protein
MDSPDRTVNLELGLLQDPTAVIQPQDEATGFVSLEGRKGDGGIIQLYELGRDPLGVGLLVVSQPYLLCPQGVYPSLGQGSSVFWF